jgi:DNA-binding MarR family transcriptional regulator
MVNQSGSDLAILLVGTACVVADRLGDAVARSGIDDMRAPFGYVIRALADRDRTLTELAGLLGVSKQAAIKVIDQMEMRGYLTRETHPDDRRVKVLRLTPKGRRVRRTALAASHRIEQELRADVGDATVDELRRALEQLLAAHDALADARAGRSRALW